MLNLIFKELPQEFIGKEEGECKHKKSEECKKGEGSVPSKYLHHHSQISQLLTILKDSPVDYSKHPSYKGT
jgi:hypothetical protein